ncbi:WD40 repeat domain-containing protein [Paenibacillus abyssi]|uniref:Uncharacterized protein n=1 Tax=Paenibacillus abyssi TaxID=1340531 RepID=A0A917G7B6_9BACL|nr:WD40 repeat domain-containing protein [Paenibacillus abyssi]GGG26436.1 hypothetical protein GCM10010916_48550 [Paenibacillus abyssi]
MGLTLLGQPLTAVQTATAAYGREAGGDRIYTVAQGKPSVLYVIDAASGQCLKSFELHGSNHSWGMCITKDGSVFIGGDGYLYRYDPEQSTVENCGLAIEGENYFWRIAADEDGNVYGGTFPGGKVFQYDSAAKRFRDYGSMIPGESYARSLDIGPDNKIYVGMGTQAAAIIELDRITGAKRKLPMPEGQEQSKLVYDLDVFEGMLFARFTDTLDLMVYDLAKEQWVCRIDQAMGLDVSPLGDDRKVYFLRNKYLHSFDLDTYELVQTSFASEFIARDFGWIELNEPEYPGKSLVSMCYNGDYWIYNPKTQSAKHIKADLAGVPVGIQSMAVGADGNLYIGGYFAGGFSSYNPEMGQLAECKRFGQTEGMLYFKDKLYLGVYPGAYIYQYDPKQPWISDLNPRIVFSLKQGGQDRPFAFTATEDKLVIGTVPTYGKLGGAMTLYDPESDSYEMISNVIPGQSVVALCYHNGFVYGGTSVYGGLGITPTEKDGKLFVWDASAKQKIWEGVPVQGERAVSALTVDGSGKVWGMTTGHLFRFDPVSRRFEMVVEIFPPLNWEERTHFWRGGFLHYDPSGVIYGNCIDKLFQFDIATHRLEVLETDVALFARGLNGEFYVTKESELYKYVD